jgi:hypothetical protein
MVSPSLRVTMAFFQSRVLPFAKRRRRGLPVTFIVFTLVTVTSKISVIASAIWGLLARLGDLEGVAVLPTRS